MPSNVNTLTGRCAPCFKDDVYGMFCQHMQQTIMQQRRR